MSGGASIVIGLLIFWRPLFVVSGLLALVALVFAVDGGSKLMAAARRGAGGAGRWLVLFAGIVNLGLAWVIWRQRASFGVAALGVFIGIRILSEGWSLLFTPVRERDAHGVAIVGDRQPDPKLDLTHPAIGDLHREAVASARATRTNDLYWGGTLAAVFLAIHVGRLQAELTFLGLISPVIAVVGDLVSALLLAAVIGLPLRLLWRRLTRPLERRVWRAVLARGDAGHEQNSAGERLVRGWLRARLNFSVGLGLARGSLGHAVWHRLRVGLPFVALLIGLNPIWGFTWYFNTENWASAFWQEVAGPADRHLARGDGPGDVERAAARGARVRLRRDAGALARATDFSFLVVGDPGEGDASQLSLRDRYLALAQRRDSSSSSSPPT